ncbi:MAG: PQQ-binding-like beta-propeller repeat protein [Candidatus Binatia bacterium]
MRHRFFPSILVAAVLLAPRLAFAAATCASPAIHPAGDWPMLNGPVTGTRHQPAESTIGPGDVSKLVPKWTFSVASGGGSGVFQSTATVAGGCVYAGTSAGWVFALNADDGNLVWKAHGPVAPAPAAPGPGVPIGGGGVFAVAVDDGRAIAGFSPVGAQTERYARAFDRLTGETLWTAGPLGDGAGEGATITASPVVFDGMVWVSMATETSPESRVPYYLLSAATGSILHKGYAIPEKDLAYGYGGGGIWSTPAVDVEAGYLYAGTSDSETYVKQHRHNNAILKIDVNPARTATFGKVVDAYKGNVDTYVPGTDRTPVCKQLGNDVGRLFRGGEYSPACGEIDIDFGASINLFVDEEGDQVVTAMQKSCVFHAVTADTLTQKWTAIHSHPDEIGCLSTAAVGDGKIFASADQPGTVWGMTTIGYPLWVQSNAVIASVPPLTYANGVVYAADHLGLVAWDAKTGVPLLYRPFAADVGEFCGVTAGGVSVARNTVYVECDYGLTGGGWIVAYSLPR